METITTQGTTLEVHPLQLYPLGTLLVQISMEHRQPSMRGAVGLLAGVELREENQWGQSEATLYGRVIMDYASPGERHTTAVLAKYLKPYLRPFEQLTEPLPDGTIPAVEALRLALGWSESFYKNRFTARLLTGSPGGQCVRIESYSDYSGGWIRLGGDFGAWLFDSFDSPQHHNVVNPCAAYDYLRSKHFAVGLEPSQFIEKK